MQQSLFEADGYKAQNLHSGKKIADIVKMLFTNTIFCAKLTILQKEIHFGCLIQHLKKAEGRGPSACCTVSCDVYLWMKKGDGQYEHNGIEAQAEKEDSGIKRFFV